VGTRNALLYQSVDGAATWKPVTFARSNAATLNALVSDPCGRPLFYAGTTDSDSSQAGVYEMVREGAVWKHRLLFAGESVMSVAVAPSDCRVLAVGTTTGVLVSRDAGETWKRLTPSGEMDRQPIVSLAFADTPDVLFAGTPKLPWKTMDGGKSWHPIHVGINDDSDIFSIAVNGARVMIGACSGIYRSIDDGKVWKKVLGIPGESRRTYVVRPDRSNARIIYAGTSNGLWKSSDAGVTWVQKSTRPARSILIDTSKSGTILVAGDTGIWKSTDGGETLKAANTGFVNRTLGGFVDAGDMLLASALYEVDAGTLFDTKNAGRDWTARPGATIFGEHVFHFAQGADAVFAAGVERFFRSSDKGRTWTRVTLPSTGTLTSVAAVPATRTVLVSTSSSLYASADAGLKWQNIKVPGFIKRIDRLNMSSDGKRWGILSNGNVLLSDDKGTTWSQLEVPPQSGSVYDFTLRGNSEILIGTLSGLFVSFDSGIQWSAPSSGLAPGTVTSVLWHPVQKQRMFLVQNGIAWESEDSGTTWRRMDASEMGNDSISEMHWAADYSKLYAVGFSRGVFVRDVQSARASVGTIQGSNGLR
jgi:photosystem II stability/assembly factor-like uncharacterized protein